MRGFDTNLKSKAENDTCYYSEGLKPGLNPSARAIVLDCINEKATNADLNQDEAREVNNVNVPLSHVVAILQLKRGNTDIDCEKSHLHEDHYRDHSAAFKFV